MNKTINKQSGVLSLAALVVIAALGAGGVYVYKHDKAISQLSANQAAMSQDIATNRAGLNVVHANAPELFARNEASVAGYQAPQASWVKTFNQ